MTQLRPQKPLRRIIINESLPATNSTPPDKKSKDEENEAFKSAEVAADQTSNQLSSVTDKGVSIIDVQPPNSSAQFYRTWRELGDDSRKCSYLKVITTTILCMVRVIWIHFSSSDNWSCCIEQTARCSIH